MKINPTNKNAKEICVNEEQRINNVLQDFYKEDKIVEKTLKKLKLTEGQLPRLYELTKVHKITFHFTLLSMPGLLYHKIRQKVMDLLSVISESKINNYTKKTVESLKTVTLDADEVLISSNKT